MESLKTAWANALAAFGRLSERERKLVTIGGIALLAFILFFATFSFINTGAKYRRTTASKLEMLREAQELAQSYDQAQAARREAERDLTANTVSLTSYLEDVGNDAGLQIPAMNPKGDVPIGDGQIIESSVEVTLTDVNVRNLYDFLTNAERGPGVVKVKYLRVEPRANDQTVTAWATIATYRLKEQ
jgi:general secretion pathway protein M